MFYQGSISGQSPSLIELKYSKSDINVPRFIAKKPLLLANYLTKDKSTEKEKFDALFAWVASNIRYNFASYYAPSGAGMPRINKILKYRTGICMDYAYLMDSLCKIAGITNVTVLGYAKDEIFDVNDSLFSDNHAWNAVRLDNKWFVYDVTWASGETEYKLTKFSTFLNNIYLKHPPKYKKINVTSKKLFTINYCDSALTKTPIVYTYYKQKFWNKWLHKQLFKFRLKVKKYNNQKINPQYYLCDPDTFSINHFPDDPIWSLVSDKKRIDFESDSAYYHLNDSTFNHQNRYGRTCVDCDNYLALDELNKNYKLRKSSLEFNSRNRFITTICEYNISKLKLTESKPLEDSLFKVTVLDTSLSYLSFAQKSLLKSAALVEVENTLQKNKNLIKANLLYDENQKHKDLIIKDVFNIKVGAATLKNLERETNMQDKKLVRRIKRIDKYDDKEIPNPKIKNTAIKLAEVNRNLKITDSIITALDIKINRLKTLLDSNTLTLSNNLKQKIQQHDSAFLPFHYSIYLRYVMKDNYKKEIVNLRRKINIAEQLYLNDLDSLVYKPSNTCLKIGDTLFNAINLRNTIEEKKFKITGELIRRRELNPNLQKEYKMYLHRQNREDICWIKNNIPNLNSAFFLLKELLIRQKKAEKILRKENIVENIRFKAVNKELNRRKHKAYNIIINNTRVVNYQLRVTNKEKRLFLQKLRRARLEASKRKSK